MMSRTRFYLLLFKNTTNKSERFTTKRMVLIVISLLFLNITIKAQNHPFPQHTTYKSHIKPTNYTQEQLDKQLTDYYDDWKKKFLVHGCDDDQYYIKVGSGTVSEAMGYGAIIFPVMEGYDPKAKEYFDGIFNYFKAHPSHITPHLMAWKQKKYCKDTEGPDSASDGDIDIAFGLLLAHSQWGSQGDIDYLKEAILVIEDIMGANAIKGDINQELSSVKLGDWVRSGHFMNGTRTSDFIMDHFRVFFCATHNEDWNKVTDNCYNLIDEMQTKYSQETGLLPDFIVDLNTDAKPANPDYLEGKHDGHYSYNACRDPWRLANDYLIFGDERAKKAVVKIDKWLFKSSEGDPKKVRAGYQLDGTKIYSWSDMSFTAPFAVGAMLDTTNQEWLNKLYSKVLTHKVNNGDYYDCTLKLLAMITISGNYWVPGCEIVNGIDKTIKRTNIFDVYPTITNKNVNIRFNLKNNTDYSLRVSDISGNVILRKNLNNNKLMSLNLESFKNGIYFISIFSKKENIFDVKKIVLQH